jgi:hypothetical protein
MSYQPQRASVAWQVVEFFRRAPDDELWSSDVVLKFGGHPDQVAVTLRPAVKAGLLSVRHESRGETGGVRGVYTAGPALTESESHGTYSVRIPDVHAQQAQDRSEQARRIADEETAMWARDFVRMTGEKA